MAESNGTKLEASPWYIKAILQLGVPAALCIYLVYHITVVDGRQNEALDQRTTAIANMLNTHADQTGIFSAETLYILRTMCVNAANTGNEREKCMLNPAR